MMPELDDGKAAELEKRATQIKTTMTTGQTLDQIYSSFMQGIVLTPASALKAIGTADQYLSGKIGSWTSDEPATLAAGKAIEDFAYEVFKTNPELQNDFWLSRLPGMIGTLASFAWGGKSIGGGRAGTGALGEEAMAAAAKQGAAAGVRAAGTLGALGMAQGQFEAAKQAGANDDDAMKAYLGGIGIGATMVVPVHRWLKRINEATGGGFVKVLRDTGLDAAINYGVGFLMTAEGNAVAKLVYDEDRDILEDAPTGGLLFAGAGVPFSILASSLRSRAGGRPLTPEEQARQKNAEVLARVQGGTTTHEGALPQPTTSAQLAAKGKLPRAGKEPTPPIVEPAAPTGTITEPGELKGATGTVLKRSLTRGTSRTTETFAEPTQQLLELERAGKLMNARQVSEALKEMDFQMPFVALEAKTIEGERAEAQRVLELVSKMNQVEAAGGIATDAYGALSGELNTVLRDMKNRTIALRGEPTREHFETAAGEIAPKFNVGPWGPDIDVRAVPEAARAELGEAAKLAISPDRGRAFLRSQGWPEPDIEFAIREAQGTVAVAQAREGAQKALRERLKAGGWTDQAIDQWIAETPEAFPTPKAEPLRPKPQIPPAETKPAEAPTTPQEPPTAQVVQEAPVTRPGTVPPTISGVPEGAPRAPHVAAETGTSGLAVGAKGTYDFGGPEPLPIAIESSRSGRTVPSGRYPQGEPTTIWRGIDQSTGRFFEFYGDQEKLFKPAAGAEPTPPASPRPAPEGGAKQPTAAQVPPQAVPVEPAQARAATGEPGRAAETPAAPGPAAEGAKEPWEMRREEWESQPEYLDRPMRRVSIDDAIARARQAVADQADNPIYQAIEKVGLKDMLAAKKMGVKDFDEPIPEKPPVGYNAGRVNTKEVFARQDYWKVVADAVKRGEPVPRETLEQFRGRKWADAALAALEAKPGAAPEAAAGKGKQVDADAARETALKEGLKKGLRGGNAGLGVGPLSDAVELGWLYVKRGVRDFARWSAEMLKDVGEWVKPHLEAIWQKAQTWLTEMNKPKPGYFRLPGGTEGGMYGEPAKPETPKVEAPKTEPATEKIWQRNPQSEADLRALDDEVQRAMVAEGHPKRTTVVQVEAIAKTYAEDPKREAALVKKYVAGGAVGPVSRQVVLNAISARGDRWRKTGDPAARKEAVELAWADHARRTRTAQELGTPLTAQLWQSAVKTLTDPAATPEARVRAQQDLDAARGKNNKQHIEEAFTKPTAAYQRQLEAIEEKLQNPALLDPAAGRLRAEKTRLLKAWGDKAEKMRLWLKGRGFDTGTITDEQWLDHDFIDRISREIHTFRSSAGDKIHEVWQMGIFSGVPSNVANIMGNIIGTIDYGVMTTLDAAASSLVSAARGGKALEGVPTLGDAVVSKRFLSSDNILGALRDWYRAQTLEARVFEEGSLGERRPTGGKWDVRGPAISGTLGRVARAPGTTLLGSADELFKSLIGRYDVMLQASRLGRERGLAGAELDSFVGQQIGTPGSEAWLAAQPAWERGTFAQPIPEGTLSSYLMKWRRGGHELATRDLFPDDTAWHVAANWAAAAGKTIIDPEKWIPVALFAKNLMGTAFAKTPGLGLVTAGIKRAQAGKPMTTAEWTRLATNQAVGVATMMGVMALGATRNKQGLPYITGDDIDPEQAKNGVPRKSILLGDRYFSYENIQPLDMVLTTIWGEAKAIRQAGRTGDMGAAAVQFVKKVGDSVADLPFMQQGKTLMDYLDNPERGDPMRFVRNLYAAFMPNLIRSSMRATDPLVRNQRTTEPDATWLDKQLKKFVYELAPVAANAPYPQVDLLGRDITKTGNVGSRLFVRNATRAVEEIDPVHSMLAVWNRQANGKPWNFQRNPMGEYTPKPPLPSFYVAGQKVELGPRAYYTFQKLAGELTVRAVAGLETKLNATTPTDQDIARLHAIISVTRHLARRSMVENRVKFADLKLTKPLTDAEKAAWLKASYGEDQE
jgi:hypothetical protein